MSGRFKGKGASRENIRRRRQRDITSFEAEGSEWTERRDSKDAGVLEGFKESVWSRDSMQRFICSILNDSCESLNDLS